MQGFQLLTDTQRQAAAKLLKRAGYTFLDVSHIWYGLDAVMVRLPTGVNVLVAIPVED